MQVRLDGKTLRGTRDADGNQRHLLAALVGPDAAASVVAAQAEVGAKTNEVPMAAMVLGQIDLTGKIVTAGALDTVKATARHIHEHGGQFVLPVKENRQTLFDRTRSGPRIMAGLRNLAIGALRLAGHADITEATRWACRSRDRPSPSSDSHHDRGAAPGPASTRQRRA
jgi:hypothetical protein